MSRSGSKRGAAKARDLRPWQERVLRVIAGSALSRELTFGGGAALSAVHLHHRSSEDLDFFLQRPLQGTEATLVGRSLVTGAVRADIEIVFPRTTFILRSKNAITGRVDFSYYPFEAIARPTTWHGLRVESLLDMTVNKVQAVLTRQQPRDLVDLFFLLREGPERDLLRLLDRVRAKFDVGAHPMGLAARLLLVHEIRELPRMIRRVTVDELERFFEARARELLRR
ncbi:MAG TPA: nucleotidyl transferase AbiEii/AbiGii toxin family protein [Labilithrix sp.]